MADAAPLADVVITLTGNKHVVSSDHMQTMKPGAVLCNGGQFVHEIDVEWLKKAAVREDTVRANMVRYTMRDGKDLVLLGDGNLVNLSCADGHPSEVMATSFLGQLMAVKHLQACTKLGAGVHALPKDLDKEIAALQLAALGVEMDVLTDAQVAYAKEWEEGY
jgi:adenosylhomocysteinase